MNKKIIITIIAGLIVFIILIFVIAFLNRGQLEIASNPSGAKIIINQKNYKQTPAKIVLPKGKYLVMVFDETHPPQRKSIEVKGRQKLSLFFDLTKYEDVKTEPLLLSGDDPILISGEHFAVTIPEDETKYDLTITLYAILNGGVNGPPMEVQEAEYYQQLKQYKQESLDWITSQGVNPANTRIQWLPPEAADLH